MSQDTLLQKITEALGGDLNPKVFEACVSELISMDFPGAVPVPGGQDGGMDGAVPDLEGEAYPIVTTTQEDVIGNFTKSIESYLSRGGKRRKVILATSQVLTPVKRTNIENRAIEYGFTLVNIYQRQSLAEKLYRNSRWRKELLGITGNPPALSKIPLISRADFYEGFVGRAEELQWLEETSSDKLIYGQPGCGKTYLLKHYAKNDGVYFLSWTNEAEVADAIRDLKPKTIILDDAHIDRVPLLTLIKLRQQLGGDFTITAASWPGEVDEIKLTLELPPKLIKDLRLLKRIEILEVIKSFGISGPDYLLHEIINQSEGRPGLAVLLSLFCINGDLESFWKGDLLAKWVLKIHGRDVEDILGAFSLGGERGLSMKSVAKCLGLPETTIKKIVSELSTAGVVSERGENLVVQPAVLRSALIREVFFSGPTSLDIEPYILLSEDPDETLHCMLLAAHRGAKIPENLMLKLLVQHGSERCWETYAELGRYETNKVLKDFPAVTDAIIDPALKYAPDKILPYLFEKAIGDKRSLNSATDHPLRKIEDWIADAWPGSKEALQRRQSLLEAVEIWVSKGKDTSVAVRVLSDVFSLTFQQNRIAPGDGRTFNLTHGFLTAKEINSISKLWPRAIKVLRAVKVDCKAVLEILNGVAYLRPFQKEIPEEIRLAAKELAKQMLPDVASLSTNEPGMTPKLRKIAEHLGLKIEFSENELYKLLFPSSDMIDSADSQKASNDVKELANRWKSRSVKEIAFDVVSAEKSAASVGTTWPRMTPHLINCLVNEREDLGELAEALLDSDASSDLLLNLLDKLYLVNPDLWANLLRANFDSKLRPYSVSIVLTCPKPPKDLLDRALSCCHENLDMVENTASQMPDATYLAVLTHPNLEVRGRAAVGEWHSQKRGGKFREQMKPQWREAVIGFHNKEYWLDKILHADSELAYEWFLRRLQNGEDILHDQIEVMKSISSKLSVEQRRNLLSQLPERYSSRELILPLVRQDLELCDFILQNEHLKEYALELVEWCGLAEWEPRVQRVIEAGYSLDEIAQNVIPGRHGWSGKESNMWQGWITTFSPLETHADENIKKIGSDVLAYLKSRYERAIKIEEREEIFGR